MHGKMKRSHDTSSGHEEPRPGEESGAEMDVEQDEEKVIDREDDDASLTADPIETEDEEEPVIQPRKQEENPFMDSFYGIASANVSERTQAAQVLLHHSLLGPDANAKDAAYALKRLLNGLCSGRAAARQGNASTLASFLKVVFALEGKMEEIRREQTSLSPEEAELSDLAYIRHRLRTATEPARGDAQGRKKNAEERDSHFGRLFGINGIVRSGILMPGRKQHESNNTSFDDIRDVTTGLVMDLAELYSYKKWIREPAAHAVCTLLNMLYAVCPDNVNAQNLVTHIVEAVVVPQLLTKGDNPAGEGESSFSSMLAAYSAEQIGIVAYIQSQAHLMSRSLPAPIDKAVLTSETLVVLAQALSETSAVTHPRTHLVWDALWSLLSESHSTVSGAKVDSRKLRKECPISKESVDDLLNAVLQQVVIERLLRAGQSDDEHGKISGKATHDRRSLALCIVRHLSGVEFVSSLSGRTRLIVPSELLETLVFSPIVVRRLLLDIICTGQQKKQSAHLLKPLAIDVIERVTQSLTERGSDKSVTLEESYSRRFAVAKALLTCEPRFDSRTKTSTIELLLGLGPDIPFSEIPTDLWSHYLAFLEQQIACSEQGPSSPDATTDHFKSAGYIDLMFQLGKRLTRTGVDEGSGFAELKEKLLIQIFGFLMSVAFFDCSSVAIEAQQESASKKKKKKKQTKSTLELSPALRTALMIRDSQRGKAGILAYEIRTVASARFFSLATDVVTAKEHTSNPEKDSSVLEFVSSLHQMKNELEKAGAKQLGGVRSEDEMETDEISHETVVDQLWKDTKSVMSQSRARQRWVRGIALLALTLHLHLLSCGRRDNGLEDDDPDADDEEDYDEITNSIADVHHVSKLFAANASSGDEEMPLTCLAELCINILSSPLGIGNQSRGASPTWFREVVKMTWTSGLNLASNELNTALDSQVVDILLNAIGAIGDPAAIEDEMEDDDDDDDSGSEKADTDDELDEGVFAQATTDDTEVTDKNEESANGPINSAADSSDVEVDPSKLRSLLEEGSDAEIDETELEHHEGADAALAKLIQLKQEARKAGQLARERTEIARQIRCFPLLETLVVGKVDTWGSLLRVDLLLHMIQSLMQYRFELAKHLNKVSQKGPSAGHSEKRALLERLSALLKGKLLKVRVQDLEWSDSVDISQCMETFAGQLMSQAKDNVNKDHPALCNSSLLFMLRAVSETESKLAQANIYADAVAEWSQKSRLESSFFEALIHQNPVLAQACLTAALASAASNAKTSFLKSESLRLLGLLYNPKLNSNETQLEKMALERLLDAADSTVLSIAACLKDPEMRKTKRVREVLRTLEKVILFLSTVSGVSSPNTKTMKEIQQELDKLQTESESQGIQKTCEKISSAIDTLKEKVATSVKVDAPEQHDDATDSEEAAATEPSKNAEASSKHKKKKSKKKKR